ncbi:MAG: hypothetical protein ACI92N_003963 [Pseudomonadales bacterium]|jgi:uncharacterized protein YjiS (DUF1127 family)|tara:strand:+ start:369 stop:602 length:234 start_codon:yes stop_codon:yes gene_type:complete
MQMGALASSRKDEQSIEKQRIDHSSNLRINLTARLERWLINWRTRRQLASMPDFMLKDIGISRSQAEQEHKKPFWKD